MKVRSRNYSVASSNILKLKLSHKKKMNLAINISIIFLFLIFFIFNLVSYSKLETIEIKLYKNKKSNFFPFIKITDFDSLKNYKTAMTIILEVISSVNFLTLYMNIIYLILHPFIGLKLIFVVNISYFCVLFLKIIIQAHRPFWELLNNDFIKKENNCKTDYASPSANIFFICFFYLYSIISIQTMKKKLLTNFQKFLLFLVNIIIIVIMIILLGITLNEYFHQLVFTIILGHVLICFLLSLEKNIHNFIFQTLKNVYNSRVYKMKIFFYIVGLIIISLIASYFINEADLNSIKLKLKDCQGKTMFGMKQSMFDLNNVFTIIGAVWGSSFTLEKRLSKWWEKSPKIILVTKIIIIVLINGCFITIKYYIPDLFNDVELRFMLNLVINFLHNFFCFGLIPLIFEKTGLTEKKERLIKKSINSIDDSDDQILFRTSIFKEKDKGEFIIIDSESTKNKIDKMDIEEIKDNEDEKDKITQIELSEVTEENELIYDKNKQKKEEISNLVENLQKIEEDEDDGIYLEGID